MKRKHVPSRDDWRAVRQEKKATAGEKLQAPKIRRNSLRRLNWLKKEFFKCDDQSMAIDLACMRLTGSLEPWKEQE